MKRCLDSTFLWELARGQTRALDAAQAWRRAGDELVTTSVNHFEVVLGIEREAHGRRQDEKRAMWARLSRGLTLLPLDPAAAELAGRRQAALFRAGRPASMSDLLIASIAAVNGCDVIVTADRRDFSRIGLVKVVNS